MRDAGFAGDFQECSDPYCQGPVPRAGDLLQLRARFIAENYFVAEAEAQARLGREYDALTQAPERYERIVLWFEHDSYDQLVLARVLAALADRTPTHDLELICIDRFAGIARFIGLGQLSPADLRSLWHERKPVSSQQTALGIAVWNALREPSPLTLHAIAAGGTPALPVMAAAITRHLQELPWTQDGLALTQRLALAQLHAGPRTVAAMFAAIQSRTEPLPFLGDLMFWAVLREMAQVEPPPFEIDAATVALTWHRHALVLTPDGAAVLAGERDWLSLRPPERWVGGVRIAPGAPAWRWSPHEGRPILSG